MSVCQYRQSLSWCLTAFPVPVVIWLDLIIGDTNDGVISPAVWISTHDVDVPNNPSTCLLIAGSY